MSTASAPRDAATVVLVRAAETSPPGGEGDFEVLLLRRHSRSGFAASMWVFPGGTVEPEDRALEAACFRMEDPARQARACGLDAGRTLGLHVAAVRETFEEAGVLLARDREGGTVDVAAAALVTLRAELNDRSGQVPEQSFHDWLAAHGAVLDLDALVPFARWITPVTEARRYDTLFLLARAPSSQAAAADEVETTAGRWMRPTAALAAHDAGELDLIFPTLVNLRWLADRESAATALADARALTATEPLRVIEPHIDVDEQGRPTAVWHPDDPDFPWDRYEGHSVRQ